MGRAAMSPEYVRPYVKAQKNDDRDAEAATRPTMRFVELKSQEQLDMQSLHRSRDRLVGDPQVWLADVRARIAVTPQTQISELLPWNWRPNSLQQAAA
jgi:hypothetical protein